MTDNISRMYELAKATKYRAVSRYNPLLKYGDYNNLYDVIKFSDDFDIELEFPPFTPEKQLELIKWLASEQNDVEISWYSDTSFRVNNFLDSCEHKDFSQALAGLVCELWEDLTEEQKEEIKRILE